MKSGSPFKFFLLIPLGTIALLFIFDFIYTRYNQQIVDNDVKEVLEMLLTRDDLHNENEYEEYAREKFTDKEYKNLDDVNVILDGENIILINYREYFSVVHFITDKKMKVTGQYVGYLNEYKEIVIEKYEEVEDIA